jgi:hypothetical protein
MPRALVICSNDVKNGGMRSDSRDFPMQVSSILGDNWKREWQVTFLSPKCRKSKTHIRGFFPQDAPRERYDMLWFCGCDGIYFIDTPILDTVEVKKRLTKGGVVLFTDARGSFPHKYNVKIDDGWLLDLRAYINFEDAQKKYWKQAWMEDVDDEETEEQFYASVNRWKQTRRLVQHFMKYFKRNRRGMYIRRIN